MDGEWGGDWMEDGVRIGEMRGGGEDRGWGENGSDEGRRKGSRTG